MIKNRVVLGKVLLSLSLVSLLVSCTNENKVDNNTVVNKKETKQKEVLAIKNFEESFYKLNKTDFEANLKSLESEYSLFFASNRPNSEWESRYDNAPLKELSDSLIMLFNDKYTWKESLSKASNIYQEEFINDIMPEVYLWNSAFEMNEGVWGYNNKLIVAMEQYLGEGHPYYNQLPRYLARKKDAKYITRDIIKEFSASKVMYDAEDLTFLNAMLKQGRQLYFTSILLPNVSDEVLLNFAPDKMKWAKENESEIWKFFVNQDLLFSTDQKVKTSFLSEAPFSKFGQEFDNKSPGKVAGWIGLQIIRSLVENDDKISLETIMGIEDAQSILTLSKYKP